MTRSEKGQKGVRARHARARALQGLFIDKWFEIGHLKEAMLASGVSWQQIQAWRRWDRTFRGMYENTKEVLTDIRQFDHIGTLYERMMAGSDRAMDLYCRLYLLPDRLCPRCLQLRDVPFRSVKKKSGE